MIVSNINPPDYNHLIQSLKRLECFFILPSFISYLIINPEYHLSFHKVFITTHSSLHLKVPLIFSMYPSYYTKVHFYANDIHNLLCPYIYFTSSFMKSLREISISMPFNLLILLLWLSKKFSIGTLTI